MEQRGLLHHPERHARRASARDPRREGSEVGGGAKTAAGSPGSSLRDTLWDHYTRSYISFPTLSQRLGPPIHEKGASRSKRRNPYCILCDKAVVTAFRFTGNQFALSRRVGRKLLLFIQTLEELAHVPQNIRFVSLKKIMTRTSYFDDAGIGDA